MKESVYLLRFLFSLLPTPSYVFLRGLVRGPAGGGTAISWGTGGEAGAFTQLVVWVRAAGWPEEAQGHAGG